jgi:hypothetical protein
LQVSKYAIAAGLNPGMLVVGGFPTKENQMGDNVARFPQIAAIVCDAPVRDYAGMVALSVPVF